jgi:hypothetical protein
MSEYIEREKALDAVVAWAEICPSTAISEIECMTAADVVPAVRGEWIEHEDEMECPQCGYFWNYCDNDTERFNYCPNCGAKMESEGST